MLGRVGQFDGVVANAIMLPLWCQHAGVNDNVITSKPTWKLKDANSIPEHFEYFCQMSSKSILIFFSYTVSNRGRPNLVFFFVFGAEKRIFLLFGLLFFGLLFFGRKRCTYFQCILFFGINMAVKITENSERFNSADARRARSTVNFSQHVQPQSALGTNVVWHCVINIFFHVLSFSVASRTRIRLVIHS